LINGRNVAASININKILSKESNHELSSLMLNIKWLEV